MNSLLLSLPRASHSSDESSSSVEIDSDIEVTSVLDEEESELIRMRECLRLTSDESDDEFLFPHQTADSNNVNAEPSGNDEIADPDRSSECPSGALTR